MKHKKNLKKKSKKHINNLKNFEYKTMFVFGIIVFLLGTILDIMYIWIPGFMLLIVGMMNRHSWDLKHK